MKQRLLLLAISLFAFSGFSQVPVGKWRDHFSYRQANYTAISNNRIYAASANGVFWYDPSNGHTGKLTTVNGLHDIGITAIEYSNNHKLLAVGYENGNIDLVLENRVVNLPYIMQKPLQGAKRINHFYFTSNGQLLVSTGFGIVVVNIDKMEIKDTYYIGEGGSDCWVNETIVFEGKIYAATDMGLLSADVNNPLLIHFESWSAVPELQVEPNSYSSLAVFNGFLLVNQSTGALSPDVIWSFDGLQWNSQPTTFTQVRNIDASQSHMVVVSREGILLYSNFSAQPILINQYESQSTARPNFAKVGTNGRLAVADNMLGLMYGGENAWTRFRPNGPDDDRAYFVMPTNNDLYVLAGARSESWGNRFFPLSFHKLSNNQWATITNHNFFDAVRITSSPNHTDEYYISSWGHGVIVYRDGQVAEHYDPNNSSLQTILPGAYCRIGGVAFDTKGNMWVTNAGVSYPISVRLADGTWKSFPYENIISSQRLSDITLSPNGYLWVVIPSGGGLFVIDPGDNPESASSHTVRRFTPVAPDGSSLPSDVKSLAFDRNGHLWLGTTEGVLVSYNPGQVLNPSEFALQYVRIPSEQEGIAAELLKSQTVTAIAVDGGNRKWFGTLRSGVYCQSADGAQQLHHFTKSNSPLPSNTIEHIGVHPTTGEVFIATDRGLISYRGDATEPAARFGKVYAFPNPVRPDFEGPITITGLVENTSVKITDIAGNLVFETISVGGQASWDGRNLRGNRVSTGVYLFFCADSTGEESAVGKILFIK